MKQIFAAALWMAVLVQVLPAQTDSSFLSTEFGFSLAPPRVESDGPPSGQAAAFFLPPVDGFAANVNVQIQPYPDTLAAYDALSRGQFRQMGWKVLHRSLTADRVEYEYQGKSQGLALHWYSVAVKRGDQVILVTATALDSAWADQAEVLLESVDSLQLTE